MAFTEKTFEVLKMSVLESMNRLGLEPMVVQPRPYTGDVTTSLYRALEALGQHFELSLQKKSRILRDKCEAVIYFTECEDPDPLKWKLDYGIYGKKLNGIPEAFKVKRNCTISRMLGDFDDALPADANLASSYYMTTYFDAARPSSSELIKRTINKLQSPKRYVYFTNCQIDKHYRVFDNKALATSCMSKAPKQYEAKREGALGDAQGDYIHPLEAYEASPNYRLALVSKTHHSEWKEGEYPFVARCMVMFTMDGKPYANCGKVYGHESVKQDLFTQLGFDASGGTRGGVIKANYSEEGELIVPYLDNSHSTENVMIWVRDVFDENGEPNERFQRMRECDQALCHTLPLHIRTSTEYLLSNVSVGSYFAVEPSHNPLVVSRPNSSDYERRWTPENEKGVYGGQAYLPTRGESYPLDDCVYCQMRNEYIHENDAIVSYDGEYYYEDDENETWTRCDITDDAYPIDHLKFSEYHNVYFNDRRNSGQFVFCEVEDDWYRDSAEHDFRDYHNHVYTEDSNDWMRSGDVYTLDREGDEVHFEFRHNYQDALEEWEAEQAEAEAEVESDQAA